VGQVDRGIIVFAILTPPLFRGSKGVQGASREGVHGVQITDNVVHFVIYPRIIVVDVAGINLRPMVHPL
jgi:hypothetical protein